jgi:hypothetical protein
VVVRPFNGYPATASAGAASAMTRRWPSGRWCGVFFAAGVVCNARGMAEYQPVEIRLLQPGDHTQVLALAPRLTEGVAAWRDSQAVLRAVCGWVESSLDSASQPGRGLRRGR